MTKLIILGSANAVPDVNHQNTHFVVKGEQDFLMVDCVGNPIVLLERVGLDFNHLTDLFLTHFHPDHVSGVPLLLMDMWLLGRQRKLNVYGLHPTIDRLEQLMDSFEWQNWPNFFPIGFHRLPAKERVVALSNDQFRVYTSPVRHLIPTMGLRIEIPATGKAIAYSCDTEPCPMVENLAQGVEVLLHEAAGEAQGHSTAAQAGQIARDAGAQTLYLIHYDARNADLIQLVADAQATFGDDVILAEDLMEIAI